MKKKLRIPPPSAVPLTLTTFPALLLHPMLFLPLLCYPLYLFPKILPLDYPKIFNVPFVWKFKYIHKPWYLVDILFVTRVLSMMTCKIVLHVEPKLQHWYLHDNWMVSFLIWWPYRVFWIRKMSNNIMNERNNIIQRYVFVLFVYPNLGEIRLSKITWFLTMELYVTLFISWFLKALQNA